MKKIKNIAFGGLLIVLSAFLSGGCTDFLNDPPRGVDIPNTISHYSTLLVHPHTINIVFPRISPTGNTILSPSSHYWMFMTDELIATPESLNNMTIAQRNAFQWRADIFTPDDHPVEWGGMYRQIFIYNLVVNEVMDATDGTLAERRQIQAEARVARAWNYMMLAQFFAKPFNPATASTDLAVPLVLEASTGQSNFTRATVQQIWDFILTELEESVPYLSDMTTSRFRMARFAGYNIMGRAYMLVHNHERALYAFTEAEMLKNRTTLPIELFNYREMMPIWTEDARWHNGEVYPGMLHSTNTENVLTRQIGVNPLTAGIGGSAPPRALIKPEFMGMFLEGDLRRYIYNRRAFEFYRREARISHNEGVDLPMFYINFAEVLARTGHVERAREVITYFRKHRFEEGFEDIPEEVVSQADLIRFIVQERLLEYMATGHRWFDMRRLWNDPLFQHLKTNYTRFDGTNTWTLTEDRLVYRIPPSVMVFNPNMPNNP